MPRADHENPPLPCSPAHELVVLTVLLLLLCRLGIICAGHVLCG
jgi:hypothetical protein